LTPSVGCLEDDPSVWYAFGYHANGVNTAPWTGMMLARLIAGSNRGMAELPLVMRGLAPRFPFAVLRRWYLRGAYLYYRILDDVA
jgi:glycine/D-amino acid oxidase-like deaminating enzyme